MFSLDLLIPKDHANSPSSKYVQSTPEAPAAYMLQSTPLLRKYSSLLDLIPTSIPFAWRILKALLTTPLGKEVEHNTVHDVVPLVAYNNKARIVSSWKAYRVSRAAFSQHDSQYSWDRSLYLVVSRYMWFNTLAKIA